MNSRNRNKTIIQILLWGSFWVLIPMILSGSFDVGKHYLTRSAVVFVAIGIIVFLNINWLLPSFYFRKKYILYSVLGMAIIVVMVLCMDYFEPLWNNFQQRMPGRGRGGGRPGGVFTGMKYLTRGVPFLLSFIGSALFEVAAYASRKEKEAISLQKEKLETEIKFLKSQINPHFLFNALNNIYSLTVLKSESAPDNLLRLSEMLRYMIYDCKEPRVALEKEIAYIRNFIDLYLLKDSRGLNVTVEIDDSRPNIPIAPMILIPLIENAFKHSTIEDRTNGWVKLDLDTNDKCITLKVSNSIPDKHQPKDVQGGIGLNNLKRQLELIYPEKHDLKIQQLETEYHATLIVYYK